MSRPVSINIEIGTKYGSLTVLARAVTENSSHRFFECVCDCGETVILRASHLYETRRYCTRSCRLLSDQRKNDLVGMRFGRWTVISQTDDIGNGTMWNCRCDCGTEKAVRGWQLTGGDTKSCGCALLEKLTIHKTPEAKTKARNKSSLAYNKRNPARVMANQIKYRASLDRATPSWLTDEDWAAMKWRKS